MKTFNVFVVAVLALVVSFPAFAGGVVSTEELRWNVEKVFDVTERCNGYRSALEGQRNLKMLNGTKLYEDSATGLRVNHVYYVEGGVDLKAGKKIISDTRGFEFHGIPNGNGEFVYRIVIQSTVEVVVGDSEEPNVPSEVVRVYFGEKVGEDFGLSYTMLTHEDGSWRDFNDELRWHWESINQANDILFDVYRKLRNACK